MRQRWTDCHEVVDKLFKQVRHLMDACKKQTIAHLHSFHPCLFVCTHLLFEHLHSRHNVLRLSLVFEFPSSALSYMKFALIAFFLFLRKLPLALASDAVLIKSIWHSMQSGSSASGIYVRFCVDILCVAHWLKFDE